MIRETVAVVAQDVQRARTALRISQNEVARRCQVHPSILSRVLNEKLTSGPAVEKVTAWLTTPEVRRAVAAAERRAKRESA